MQEKSSWHDNFSQPVFLKHLNKTHQGIMCETEIKIAYINKHAYKDKEETIHVKIGEKDLHYNIYLYIYIYISKISTMDVKMVTRLVYVQEAERSS